MQTHNRILQATVVLMALFITIGVADAQTKKAKKKTPTAPLKPTDLSIEILDTSVAVLDSIPSVDEFVSVEVEPYPITDIQSLVEYPEKAKKAGLEGKVILSALIDTNGKVIKVEVDRSTNPIFEESARKALMKARFSPALQNRKPVKLWYTLPIVYKLEKESNTYKIEAQIQTQEPVEVINRPVIVPLSTEYTWRYDNANVDVEPQPLQDIYSLVEYPEEAKKAGVEGRVVVYALIDTSGKVIEVVTDSSGYTILEESARKAMLKVRFTPALKDGKAVQYWYTMPILFKPYTMK
jgi:TonB family protein